MCPSTTITTKWKNKMSHIHAGKQNMNRPWNIMLSEISHIQRDKYYIILFVWSTYNTNSERQKAE